jgi:Cadherin cytoplasmic region
MNTILCACSSLHVYVRLCTCVVLALIVAIYTRRHRPQLHGVYVDPNDDIRENIIHYDEEGVGKYFVCFRNGRLSLVFLLDYSPAADFGISGMLSISL